MEIVPLVDPVPQIVQAPILPVDKDHRRTRRHVVETGWRRDLADQGIAENRLSPVVPARPEQESVEKRRVLLGKNAVVEGGGAVLIARVNAQRLARTVDRGVAMQTDADVPGEGQ